MYVHINVNTNKHRDRLKYILYRYICVCVCVCVCVYSIDCFNYFLFLKITFSMCNWVFLVTEYCNIENIECINKDFKILGEMNLAR